MARSEGLKLTQVGVCCNPACGQPLYAELMVFADDEACFECVAPRAGIPTAWLILAEQNGVTVTPEMTMRELIEKLPPRTKDGELWF